MLAKLDADKLFFKWLPAGLLACGIILIYLHVEFNVEYVGHYGIGFVGLSILNYGVIEILRYYIARSHEARKPDKEKKLKTVAAFAHAAVLLMIGAALVLYALLYVAGLADDLILYIGQRPGIAWLFCGVLAIAFSVSANQQMRPKKRGLSQVLVILPNVFLNVVMLIFGVTASMLGLIEIFLPLRYQLILSSLSVRISALLF